jgi:hypothetical protein
MTNPLRCPDCGGAINQHGCLCDFREPVSSEPPPLETPIWFLASEFGCEPEWFAGFMWRSKAPGQEPKFFIYPEFIGLPSGYPPFNAPPYAGKWKRIKNKIILSTLRGYHQCPN